MMNDMRAYKNELPTVAFIPEWYGQVMSACASIRLYAFLRELSALGRISLQVLVPEEIGRTRADVFLWHRVALSSEQVRGLAEHAGKTSAALIYDLDDNLLEMDDHPEKDAYAPMQDAVNTACRIADTVWCSTQRLSDRVRALTGAARVDHHPNALDPFLWPDRKSPRTSTDSLQLLYMGTRTHEEDFAFLYKCVEAARCQGQNVELHVVGVRNQDRPGPEWLHTVEIPAYVGASYPAFVHWISGLDGFDVGVAPLLSGLFNDCKSHIKVLDYAAMGLPAIASNMPAYADVLENGTDVMLAENTLGGWIEVMAKMHRHVEREAILSGASTLIGFEPFIEACERRWASIRAATVGFKSM